MTVGCLVKIGCLVKTQGLTGLLGICFLRGVLEDVVEEIGEGGCETESRIPYGCPTGKTFRSR